jgi:hypothetical protein
LLRKHCIGEAPDLLANARHILPVRADRGNPGGKVAVGALGAAKRNRNVNTERIHPAPDTILLSILTST